MGERLAGVVGVGFVWVSVRVVGVWESSVGFASVARASGFYQIERSGSAFYIKINFKQKLVFCVSAFNQFILAMRRVEHCGSAWGTGRECV